MDDGYAHTRARLEAYFDGAAHAAWTALTSDAPVSRIRQTVREGRDAMRAALLAQLPDDLAGARVLDAGCGPGQLAMALARRGASVLAIDISPKSIALAKDRTPADLAARIDYRAGDMLEESLGLFDHAVAMDSLIHYRPDDVASALDRLAPRVAGRLLFTLAPRTPLLSAMHAVGKAFPRSDRAPAIAPVSELRLRRALTRFSRAGARRLVQGDRIAKGFYISQAYRFEPAVGEGGSP